MFTKTITTRIYTENVNKDYILTLADAYFPAYTVLEGQGVWQGVPERCLIIEIITIREDLLAFAEEVNALAEEIKEHNNQDAVLVTYTQGSTVTV